MPRLARIRRVQLRIFVEPQFGATYADQLAIAQAAEAHGFDAFFRSDHFLTMGGDGGAGPTDSWVTLGAIARETGRIRLGTMVTAATFRQPGHLAIMVAQVDEMSGGRVELGLGAGWFEAEHTAYGFPFPPAIGERLDRLTEQLEIVTGLWRTPAGERFSHDGRHYQLDDSPALPKPLQRPAPPVIVGGMGAKRTPALAARFASEYNVPFAGVDAARGQYARVRAACEAAGRDPGTLALSHAITVFCGADEAQARRRAEASGMPAGTAGTGVIGTPEQIAERLREYAGAGAQRSYLQLLDMRDLEHLALLADEVMPLVA
jgi:F420-dependent oxidoreductase-like protein